MLQNPDWDKKSDTQEEWRRVLLDAAELIRTKGWCKNRLQDDKGQLCIQGAIIAAIIGEENVLGPATWDKVWPIVDITNPKLAAACGDPEGQVHWNNKVAKKPEQVIELLETVARS